MCTHTHTHMSSQHLWLVCALVARIQIDNWMGDVSIITKTALQSIRFLSIIDYGRLIVNFLRSPIGCPCCLIVWRFQFMLREQTDFQLFSFHDWETKLALCVKIHLSLPIPESFFFLSCCKKWKRRVGAPQEAGRKWVGWPATDR